MGTAVGAGAGQEIQELLDKAERLMQRIRDKLSELVSKINSLLSAIPGILVPDFVVDAIEAGIRKMNEVFDQLVSKVQEFFDSPGWPPTLFAAGDSWLNGVARAAAETEEKINADRLNVDTYWRGTAAEAYTSTLGTQQSAFAAMADVARKIKGDTRRDCHHRVRRVGGVRRVSGCAGAGHRAARGERIQHRVRW